MMIRPLLLSAVLATGALYAMSATAHDPREFDRMMQVAEAQATPTTCTELAERGDLAADAANPKIKALKTRCDAESMAAMQTQKAAKPAAKPVK